MTEGKATEVKREYVEDIKYTAVVFANTDGGKIYIGINDDGSVQGVNDTDTRSGTLIHLQQYLELQKKFLRRPPEQVTIKNEPYEQDLQIALKHVHTAHFCYVNGLFGHVHSLNFLRGFQMAEHWQQNNQSP